MKRKHNEQENSRRARIESRVAFEVRPSGHLTPVRWEDYEVDAEKLPHPWNLSLNDLIRLPVPGVIPSRVASEFRKAALRVCDLILAAHRGKEWAKVVGLWRLLLALPKVALPEWKGKGFTSVAIQVLQHYPMAQPGYVKQLHHFANKPREHKEEDPQGRNDEEKRARNAMKVLKKHRSLKRAMKVLKGNGLAPGTEEVLQQLQNLHPGPRYGDKPMPQRPPGVSWGADDVDIILRVQKLDESTASLYAWSAQLLKQCTDSSSVAPNYLLGLNAEERVHFKGNAMVRVLRLFIEEAALGRWPEKRWTLASQAIPAYKDPETGRVRPLTLLCQFYRVCSQEACARSSLVDKFYVEQQAAFKPGGAEIIIHRFRELLESKTISEVQIIDLKNAFNTLSRKYLGEAIMELDPKMLPSCSGHTAM